MKGINLNQHLLSLIYIFDIILVLITFVIGSFIAFLDDFRLGEDSKSAPVIALMIIAIVATSLKILVSCIAVTI